MSIRTMTTGQEKRKTIPKPNPNLNPVSMICAATRSNMSRYGAIPTRKAAPLIKRPPQQNLWGDSGSGSRPKL
jgi:hypothetical protein